MNTELQKFITAGKILTPVAKNAKNATEKGWRPATNKELEDRKGNWAWVLDDNDLIIDIDTKNGNPGKESFQKLKKKLGKKVKLKKTVKTPSGGYHVYLKKPSHIETAYKLPDYPGIEFLRKGNICLVPGSDKVVYKGGKEGVYKFREENDQLVQNDAPEALLDLLSVKKTATPAKKTTPAKKPATTPAVKKDGKITLTVDTDNVSEYEKWPVEMVRDMLNSLEPSMRYPDWLKVGQGLHSWDDVEGLELWEEWSSVCAGYYRDEGHAVYKPGETQNKWLTFSNDGSGITLASVVQMAKDAGYEPKPIKTNTNADTSDTDADGEDNHEWARQWVKVSNLNKFFNKETRELITHDDFNCEYDSVVPDGKQAVRYAYKNKLIERVSKMYYMPFSDEPIVTLGVEKVANSYNPATRPDAADVISEDGKKAIKLLQDHIKLVFGDGMVDGYDITRADLFLNWIAHNYQHPGVLVGWAPLVQSIPGIGKSFFSELLENILGETNVGVVQPEEVDSNFTGWADDNVAVSVFEELQGAGKNKYQVFNKLKPFITNKRVRSVKKGVDGQKILNTTNYLAFTNHRDALPIDSNDRRWWVIFCPVASKDEFVDVVGKSKHEYFGELFRIVKDHRDEIVKYFADFQISDVFKIIREAPDSQEKTSMVSTEMASIKGLDEAKYIIDQGNTQYVARDVVSSMDLFKQLEIEDRKNGIQLGELSNFEKRDILKHLGFSKIEGRATIDKSAKWLWTTKPGNVTRKDAVKILREHNASIEGHVETDVYDFPSGKPIITVNTTKIGQK